MLTVATFAVVGLCMSTAALAHHALAAEYDAKAPVVLKGVLTKLDWVNPHGWVYIDVKNPDGTVTNWAVETGGPNALLRRGVRRSDFVMGVEVSIDGFKAKSGKPVAAGQTLKTADGKNYFLSSESVQ